MFLSLALKLSHMQWTNDNDDDGSGATTHKNKKAKLTTWSVCRLTRERKRDWKKIEKNGKGIYR